MLKKVWLFFLFFSATLHADECNTWGCMSTIEELFTTTTGYVYVGTPFDETKANCQADSGVYFVLNMKNPNAREVYSSLLAAYMSDKKIQLRIIEGSPICEISYVRLSKQY
ncbi:hypothetical protein [Bowmanella denitrificans]|uniref:hypothetical protein n=1 Tax=Bowmanella denitrificans TaxID=366582 RepID=UPI000C9A2425|nr:hypothetical protein [Bowmanella denitrificans]